MIVSWLAAACWAVWWGVHLPYFGFESLTVSASKTDPFRHLNDRLVSQAVLPKVKGNFFTADLDAVRKEVESAPWVRSANLRREWPDKLIAELEEFEVMGTWGADGKFLSTKGDIFVVNAGEAEEAGRQYSFDGPVGSAKEVLRQFVMFQSWFADSKVKPVSVVLSERGEWSLKLSTGLMLELGKDVPSGALRMRVDRFKKVLPTLTASYGEGLAVADMRYPSGLSIKSVGKIVPAKPAVALN